mmetsp:Transcript_13876/g.34903  ORF Transcript_13876/g.34903 Transcript_13876/m.34903 type:complete len:275 (-) Transcript_13876:57-881(-)
MASASNGMSVSPDPRTAATSSREPAEPRTSDTLSASPSASKAELVANPSTRPSVDASAEEEAKGVMPSSQHSAVRAIMVSAWRLASVIASSPPAAAPPKPDTEIASTPSSAILAASALAKDSARCDPAARPMLRAVPSPDGDASTAIAVDMDSASVDSASPSAPEAALLDVSPMSSLPDALDAKVAPSSTAVPPAPSAAIVAKVELESSALRLCTDVKPSSLPSQGRHDALPRTASASTASTNAITDLLVPVAAIITGLPLHPSFPLSVRLAAL